jgi:hypothetical protein
MTTGPKADKLTTVMLLVNRFGSLPVGLAVGLEAAHYYPSGYRLGFPISLVGLVLLCWADYRSRTATQDPQ